MWNLKQLWICSRKWWKKDILIREWKPITKNQTEISELKNRVSEIENSKDGFNRRWCATQGKIQELEARSKEGTWTRAQRKEGESDKSRRDRRDSRRRPSMRGIGVPRRKGRRDSRKTLWEDNDSKCPEADERHGQATAWIVSVNSK